MPPRELSREDVLRLLGVSEEFLRALERERLFLPDPDGRFRQPTLERVRICWSLHHELGVNLAGVEVALAFLERIEAERRQFSEVLA